MGYIYIIKNTVNNKVYIGQTVYFLNRRWNQHLSKCKTNNSLLYKEMRRIGVEHFWMELIEQCDNSILDKKEVYYINKFNSYYDGYNSTLGGHGGAKYDLDDELIISMYNNYGINYIAEYFNCHPIVIKSLLIKNKVDLREYTIDKVRVSMFDKQYNIVKNFESKRDAWIWLLNNYRDTMKDSEAYTYIGRACKYGNTAFGYKWIYTDDLDFNDENTIIKNIAIQALNKSNKDKEEKLPASSSLRNIEKNSVRNISGRPGIACELNLYGEIHRFDRLYKCIEFICSIEGETITSNKVLRSRANNLRKALENGIKYKG